MSFAVACKLPVEMSLSSIQGDQFQGSLMCTIYKDAAAAEFMEAVGIYAMAGGNHEFNDGPQGLATFIENVSFPVIMGNLQDLVADNLCTGYRW